MGNKYSTTSQLVIGQARTFTLSSGPFMSTEAPAMPLQQHTLLTTLLLTHPTPALHRYPVYLQIPSNHVFNRHRRIDRHR